MSEHPDIKYLKSDDIAPVLMKGNTLPYFGPSKAINPHPNPLSPFLNLKRPHLHPHNPI